MSKEDNMLNNDNEIEKVMDNEVIDGQKFVAIEAQCISCNRIWNISLLNTKAKSVRCEACNGYVITPDGEAAIRRVPVGQEVTSPLLDGKKKPEIITDMNQVNKDMKQIDKQTDKELFDKVRQEGGSKEDEEVEKLNTGFNQTDHFIDKMKEQMQGLYKDED